MTTTRTVAFYNLELKDIVVRPIRGDDGFILAPWGRSIHVTFTPDAAEELVHNLTTLIERRKKCLAESEGDEDERISCTCQG
ncbi:hypothetical protein LCGC14_0645360 [marine sediment metagenome]|uniref:DUF3467 domain-containing protein n=1 Tax=marine sediment metagenome TaxID=412755 RepID=A0A0F9QXY4_9ZZZZ